MYYEKTILVNGRLNTCDKQDSEYLAQLIVSLLLPIILQEIFSAIVKKYLLNISP
jgi:hypothetical protein